MIHESHNPKPSEHAGELSVPALSLEDLIACARSAKLYEGPDAAGLPEAIQERLTSFLKHALKESGGVPQRYAVWCDVFPISPREQVTEPQEILEYDYDFDLGTNQTLLPTNYRYLDDRQRIELDIIQRKDWTEGGNGSWLYWPEDVVELFRRIPGEDIGTYHTFVAIKVILYESERKSGRYAW